MSRSYTHLGAGDNKTAGINTSDALDDDGSTAESTTSDEVALSVSQALKRARSSLEQIAVTIVGEVSEFSDKQGYKAVYFTLADEHAALPCLMWKNVFAQARVALRKGMLVEAAGVFTLYAAKGRLNFEVRRIRLAGEGQLRLKVAELAAKLEAEGLFAPERKLPLPNFPQTIGLVTSPRGKAVHDVLRTLKRRFPLARVLLAGVAVEGEGAAAAMTAGLKLVGEAGAEVILLVRGGGSFEDMMPFNDEGLARAIATSPVPVISGIGHEPDNSIADMAASLRASTPTAAAEHASPDLKELAAGVESQLRRLRRAQAALLTQRQVRLAELAARPVLVDPAQHLRSREITLEATQMRLQQALFACADREQRQAEHLAIRLGAAGRRLLAAGEMAVGVWAAKLESLSPLAVLARGYSVAYGPDGRIVARVDAVDLGAQIDLRLTDGSLACRVEGRTRQEEAGDGRDAF